VVAEAPLVRVQQGGREDATLLAEIGARTFRDAFGAENEPGDMNEYLASSFGPGIQMAEILEPGCAFLLAEVAGDAVGYARLRVRAAPPAIRGARPIEIVRFYSDTSWIGRGVGPALMVACVESGRELGCDVAWLDVWELNPRAIAFYRKWGFEVVGEAEFRLGSDVQHDLLMSRVLDPLPGPSTT
jgi:diamine N-acetyltransferase